MPIERRIVFLLDLLQDVSILRPLIRLAALDLRLPVHLLISHRFMERDAQGLWREEVEEIARDTGAATHVFNSEWEAFQLLQTGSGALISSSETDLSVHAINHGVFCVAPPSYLRITVQHGFECVGFLQNHEHDLAHGRNVTFAADVICGWSNASTLTAMPASQRGKLYVSGPPAVLQMPERIVKAGHARLPVVCENLHSVRFRASGNFQVPFMDIFFGFCSTLAGSGEQVALRPHPAGQYFAMQNIALPANVEVENRPAYKVDFGAYELGISAPSSVLIDMLLARIPVAVWRDEMGVMDTSHYAGLPMISSLADWLAFRDDVATQREALLQTQAAFLERLGMPTEAADVRTRFLRLMANCPGIRGSAQTTAPATTFRRAMFVANALIPTLQLSFLKPFMPLREAGQLEWIIATEQELKEQFGSKLRSTAACAALIKRFDEFLPDILVFCRYSGPHSAELVAHARARGVPTILHIDDDLLNVPIELGKAKFDMHNHPARLKSVGHLLNHTDLVYASTFPLERRFRHLGVTTPISVGEIYCSGSVLNPAEERPVMRIGYMGFDHAHDFEIVVPAIIRYLDRYPEATFSLFGSIPKPAAFDRFGDRFVLVPPVRDYAEFMTYFASLNWDIGICPLAPTPFNDVKANTKWVEYTSVGAAVIASRDTVYNACSADGCGILAETEQEWFEALEALTQDPRARFEQVRRAQERLLHSYSVPQLRRQVLDIFREATKLHSAGPVGLSEAV